MKIRVNDDAFAGLTEFNGLILSASKNKSGKHHVGASGKTKAFNTPNSGHIYLSEDQYTVL